MQTEVTLVSHKAHTQQALVHLLRLLAQHQVCCRQLSMLSHHQRPYLALVITVPSTENTWLQNLLSNGLDAIMGTFEPLT